MGQIEWAMWANEQAIVTSFITVSGGIIGITGFFKGWEFGIYGVVAGLLILLFEYPRGMRKKGTTMERKFQRPIARLLSCCGPVTRNYFVRFVMYLLLCVPLCFILATLLGGVCLFITSVIYLVAAMKGEQWIAFSEDEKPKENVKDLKSFRQPKRPPPRAPRQEAANRI